MIFWQAFAPAWQQGLVQMGQIKRRQAGHLSASKAMPILIHFHQSDYRTFKAYYTQYVAVHLRAEFPALVSYTCFIDKLHLVVNDHGELLACPLTPGNVDDRRPVPQLAQDLFGKLIGDKGFLSQALVETLLQQSVELLTPLKRTMKQRLVRLTNKLLVRKRVIIETITDPLKTFSQVEQSHHRSPANFLVNVVCALIAYCHQPKQPALHIPDAVLALPGH